MGGCPNLPAPFFLFFLFFLLAHSLVVRTTEQRASGRRVRGGGWTSGRGCWGRCHGVAWSVALLLRVLLVRFSVCVYICIRTHIRTHVYIRTHIRTHIRSCCKRCVIAPRAPGAFFCMCICLWHCKCMHMYMYIYICDKKDLLPKTYIQKRPTVTKETCCTHKKT